MNIRKTDLFLIIGGSHDGQIGKFCPKYSNKDFFLIRSLDYERMSFGGFCYKDFRYHHEKELFGAIKVSKAIRILYGVKDV